MYSSNLWSGLVFIASLAGQEPPVYSTLVGGMDWDEVQPGCMVVDADGVVTMAGFTLARRPPEYPTTAGAWDRTHNGGVDVFITRLDPSRPSGEQILYSTFLGGSGGEQPLGLSVDESGVVTVVGRTDSPDFPTTPGAWDRSYHGGGPGSSDAFITRLDLTRPSGEQLLYSTYLGGLGNEEAVALSVDPSGVMTVVGWTNSMEFPRTRDAWDTSYNGGGSGWDSGDVFITRLDPSRPSAEQIIYSTFLGGRSSDKPRALAIDSSGVVSITGWTDSEDYATTSDAWDPTFNGRWDAFVSRLDPSAPPGEQLLYSTFLGGSEYEDALDLSVDAQGVLTVTGRTDSGDFPSSQNAWDQTVNGAWDVFVTRLDPSQPPDRQLGYSTLIGGGRDELALDLAVDAQGRATIAGWTASGRFPVTVDAFDTTFNGGWDAFLARLDPLQPAARQLEYSTFIGGAGYDQARALVVDGNGMATVLGMTMSPDYPTTPDAWEGEFHGGLGWDLFVTRLELPPPAHLSFGDSTPGCQGPLPIAVVSGPRVGNAAFVLTCGKTPLSDWGVLALSSGRLETPTVLHGVQIWVDLLAPTLALFPAQSDASGLAEVHLPIPADQGLAGLRFFAQFAWADPCAPGGVSASSGMSITVY